jgi:RNA polymerase sigma-70 factor (ECF subfamily)
MTLLKKSKSKGKAYFTSDVLPDVITNENKAFEDESLNQLYGAIRHLSEVDRALILLYLEEKSHQEIADILGTNANNIGVRVSRIKERLKKILYEKLN